MAVYRPITLVMEKSARIGYIDGCRAVAVLSVMVYHCLTDSAWAQGKLSLPMGRDPVLWTLTLISKGVHGVDLFFVISGFCLAYPMLAALARDGEATFSVARFFSRRIVRILPPYYAVLCICVVVLGLAPLIHLSVPGGMDTQARAGDIVRAIFMLDRGTHLVDGATWTLFIEFRWYLVFPLLLGLYLTSKRAFAVVIVACIIAYNFTRARSLDLGVLPAFMLGIVAADWQVHGHPLRKHAALLAIIALDVAFFLEPYTSVPGPDGTEVVGFYVQTNTGWHLAAFFFVVAAGAWAPLRALLSTRALAAVGIASYSIYLVHQPLVSYVTENYFTVLGPFGTIVVSCAVSLVAGFSFWAIVERPFCSGHPVHDRLVRALSPKIAWLLERGGLPTQFTRRSSLPVAVTPAEPSTALAMPVSSSQAPEDPAFLA
jgi:peptidoglycan/LPS O-acetylase OafA/YrhL